jgi:hypothetical protein
MTDKPVNGPPPDLSSVAAQITDEALVKLDHAEWLGQFATVLGMQRPNGPPMSVFRQGSIAKLRMAQRYIRLLQDENTELKRQLSEAI